MSTNLPAQGESVTVSARTLQPRNDVAYLAVVDGRDNAFWLHPDHVDSDSGTFTAKVVDVDGEWVDLEVTFPRTGKAYVVDVPVAALVMEPNL